MTRNQDHRHREIQRLSDEARESREIRSNQRLLPLKAGQNLT